MPPFHLLLCSLYIKTNSTTCEVNSYSPVVDLQSVSGELSLQLQRGCFYAPLSLSQRNTWVECRGGTRGTSVRVKKNVAFVSFVAKSRST